MAVWQKVKSLLKAGEIDQKMYDAWEKIDEGALDNVEKGSNHITFIEQTIILKDGYGKINDILWTLGIGKKIAKAMSDEAKSGLPKTKSFRDVCGPDARV